MYMNRKGLVFGRKDAYHTWNLSKIIHDWLVNFKKEIVLADKEGRSVGVPIDYYPEGYQFGNIQEERHDEIIKEAWSAWLSDLDKMIFAFDRKNAYEFEDVIRARVEEGRELFSKMYADLWW